MEQKTRHTVVLSPDEVREAIREYVALHSCGELYCAGSINVFAVFGDESRHSDFKIEAEWFE